jgi:hypothetical protein
MVNLHHIEGRLLQKWMHKSITSLYDFLRGSLVLCCLCSPWLVGSLVPGLPGVVDTKTTMELVFTSFKEINI